MWDWTTFGVCVASIVPSALLVGLFLRFLLKNSEKRCFKGSSEDCEILISTTTRPRPVLEILHEFTHREVVPNLDRSLGSPPGYAATDQINSLSSSVSSATLPPVYGSVTPSTSAVIPPVYGSQVSVSSIPLNINSLITSLDLLPEFAAFPPPPTYDEAIRDNVTL